MIKQRKKKVKYTNEQLGALADAFNRSVLTIKRWAQKGDDRLTSDKAKAVLEKFNTASLPTPSIGI